MPSHGFADFLEQLQSDGQLSRCDDSIRNELQVAAKAAEVAPRALLLTDVAQADSPLILGLFSCQKRIVAALGVSSLAETSGRLVDMLRGGGGGSWLDRLGGETSSSFRKFQPKNVRNGPTQQIVRLDADVDLSRLPVPTFHPDQRNPALTAGRLITKEPDGDRLLVERHDFQIVGPNRLVASWAPCSEPARLLALYRRRGRPMPVALAFGGDPLDLLVAMAPLPPQADVPGLSGFLKGRPCELVPARRVDLVVPADAELVIEGFIDPSEPPADPGCGLDAMAQIRPLRSGPVVRVEAVTHRPTPLFHALLPEENGQINRALVRAFLPFLRRQLPALVDLELPDFGGGRLWAFASIDKTYAGQGRQFADALWALPGMIGVRYLVVVDEQVDVCHSDEVWAAVSTHATPAGKIRLGDAPPDEFLHDQPPGRVLFDATRPLT